MLYTFTLDIYKHAILKSRFNLNQHLVPKIDTTLTIYLEVLAQFIGSVQLLLLAWCDYCAKQISACTKSHVGLLKL